MSQSALFAEMQQVSDGEAPAVRQWLDAQGHEVRDRAECGETDLTDDQILAQCKMYIAALRIADDFGCDAIGIQYQQGLKDLAPASDLVEGLLNNVDRPPVKARDNGRVLYEGNALPHFNEVDECAGLDGLVTYRIWTALGFDPETTLHDVRYGESYAVDGKDEFVWVFVISGAVPPAHLIGRVRGRGERAAAADVFPAGRRQLEGRQQAGRDRLEPRFRGRREAEGGSRTGAGVELPQEETERRWQKTTPQWPIMHAVLYGVTRDQMMARHKSNHMQVAYAPDATAANLALAAKAAMFREMGLEVAICGTDHGL